jgi:hypothetical protein
MLRQQRTGLILLAIAGLLGGGVYWSESRKVSVPPIGQAIEGASQPIVDAQESDIQGLGIKTLIQTIVLDKTGSTWTLRSPKPEGTASDASVAYLTSLLVGRGDRLPTITGLRKAEFGLDLYAAVNPPVDPNAVFPVMLVSPSFESAVTRAIGEWRSAKLKNPAK